MATLDEELQDEGYVRWVQIGTCLGFVKMGLEDFVLQQSQVLQQRVKNLAGAPVICQDAEIEKQKKHGKWTMSCNISRNCQNCQKFLDELVNVCKPPFKFSYRHFENSNIHLWPVDMMHWNMAKVYMSPDLDPTQQSQNPQDTDLSNILNFIEHCNVPALAINDQNNLSGVRKCRNEVMHTSSFTVTEADFKSYINSMDLLLNDQTRVAWCDDAQKGASKIKEIRDSQSFTITTDAEFRVLKERALELQEQNKTKMAAVEDLEKECEDLEGKDDEQSKTNLAELVQEIENKQESLKELESTFKKLNAYASRNKDLKGRLQPYTDRARTDLNVSQHQFSEIRNKYKRDRIDNEPDGLDEATEQYETDEEKYDAMKEISRSLIRENKDLKAEVETLKENVETVATKNTICDNRINELENELQILKSTNTTLHNHIEQKDRTIEDIKKLYEEQVSENKTNEHKIASYEMQIEQLKEELKKEADEKEEELQMHNTDNATFANTIREKENDIENLRIDITHLATVNNELKLKLSDMKNEVEKIESDLQKCKLKNEALVITSREKDDKIRKFATEVEALCKNKTAMEIEIQHQSDKKAEYEACINEIQQKTKSEQQEIEKIIEQLKLLEQDYTEAQADAKYLTKDINVLIEAKISQDGTIAQLKKANIEIVTQIQNLEIKNEDITRKLQTACNKNKISRNNIREKDDEIENLRIDITRLAAENNELKLKLSDMQNEVENKESNLQKYKLKNEALVSHLGKKTIRLESLKQKLKRYVKK